jgi:hypothetical protein
MLTEKPRLAGVFLCRSNTWPGPPVYKPIASPYNAAQGKIPLALNKDGGGKSTTVFGRPA